jgi:hypothetical protein
MACYRDSFIFFIKEREEGGTNLQERKEDKMGGTRDPYRGNKKCMPNFSLETWREDKIQIKSSVYWDITLCNTLYSRR